MTIRTRIHNAFAITFAAALILTPMAASAMAPAPDEAQSMGTNWNGIHKSRSGFGIDIDFEAGVTAKVTSGNYASKTSVDAHADGLAECELFGEDIELVSISLSAASNYNALYSAAATVKVAGITVKHKTWGSDFGMNLGEWTVAGVGGEASFGIFGINVSAEASAGGTLSLDVEGELGLGEVSVAIVPSFTVGADVSASISAGSFRVGVSGDLTLASIAAPASATLSHDGGSNFTAGFGLDLDWEALSGNIRIYVEEKYTGIEKSQTVFSYGGYGGGYNLLSTSVPISF